MFFHAYYSLICLCKILLLPAGRSNPLVIGKGCDLADGLMMHLVLGKKDNGDTALIPALFLK